MQTSSKMPIISTHELDTYTYYIWQRLMSYGLCKKSRTASLEFLECHTRPQYVDGENVGPQSP